MAPSHASYTRKDGGEALTGETAGWALSREMLKVQGADAVEKSGRPHGAHRHGEVHASPARSETPRTTHAGTPSAREPGDPWAAWQECARPRREGFGRDPLMHGPGKSDPPIVPGKRPNRPGRGPGAEAVEGRGGAEGTADRQSTGRTQSRGTVSQASVCVRDVAGSSGFSSNTRGGSRVR